MIWLLAGMFLVTYVPRLVPFLFAGQLDLPRWVRKWLKFFPYAALGALIFPGILTAVPGRPALAARPDHTLTRRYPPEESRCLALATSSVVAIC